MIVEREVGGERYAVARRAFELRQVAPGVAAHPLGVEPNGRFPAFHGAAHTRARHFERVREDRPTCPNRERWAPRRCSNNSTTGAESRMISPAGQKPSAGLLRSG